MGILGTILFGIFAIIAEVFINTQGFEKPKKPNKFEEYWKNKK